MTQAAALFGARLVEFNQLPSRTLHPSRQAGFLPAGFRAPQGLGEAWHRHWSRDILTRLGLLHRPVQDAGRPELALALLPPERLARLERLLGATLCAPRLRRAIDGAQVRHLLSALGPDILDFARQTAAGLHPGVPALPAFDAAQAAIAVDRLGRAALREALRGGGPELAERAELKLPALDGEPSESLLDSAGALALALRILKLTEPSWHSSFPAIP